MDADDVDYEEAWQQHLQRYPVGLCAICSQCGGSSISRCACAKARWIAAQNEKRRLAQTQQEELKQLANKRKRDNGSDVEGNFTEIPLVKETLKQKLQRLSNMHVNHIYLNAPRITRMTPREFAPVLKEFAEELEQYARNGKRGLYVKFPHPTINPPADDDITLHECQMSEWDDAVKWSRDALNGSSDTRHHNKVYRILHDTLQNMLNAWKTMYPSLVPTTTHGDVVWKFEW